MTKELTAKKIIRTTMTVILLLGMFSTSMLFLVDAQKVSADDSTITTNVSTTNDVTISATPAHSAFSPIQQGTSNTLSLEVGANAAHNGQIIRVWNPLAPPVFGPLLGCDGFSPSPPNPPPPGTRWELKADADGNGSFETSVTYTIPLGAGNRIIFDFGDGGGVSIIKIGTVTVTPNPSLLPPSRFAWVDQLGNPNTDNTNVLGNYVFASCGLELNNQPFRGDTTFLVIDLCTELTKTASPKTGNPPLSVTYTYMEDNCGNTPLRNVFINDIGEDANNNNILNAGEDSNSNGILEPGCDPVPGGAVDVIRVAGDTDRDGIRDAGESWIADGDLDNDGNLDPPEIWTFKCTRTVTDLDPKFTNTAFTTGTICLVADCSVLDGTHTGNPACTPQQGTICDAEERDDETVTPPPQRGTIIIKKDTLPNGPQDFKFTHNIPGASSPFFLDDDFSPPLSNMRTFLEVPAGTYTVTEMIVPAIPLRSIRCISDNDPADTSIRIGNSASIDLDAGETVTCTFVNGIQQPPCEEGIVSVPQPEDAISMTTVKNKNIVKTIHAEKQIFDCELDNIQVIADVTIIAEIYEDLNTKSVISKQVEVVTCIKDPVAIRVMECALSIPTTDRIPVTNCLEQTDITHPQEMDTANKGNTAKTIESQKEVFICTFADGPDQPESQNPNDKKVDLVIFTEIYQNLDTRTSDTPQILSMKCVIKIDTVTVESCRFTNHPV